MRPISAESGCLFWISALSAIVLAVIIVFELVAQDGAAQATGFNDGASWLAPSPKA